MVSSYECGRRADDPSSPGVVGRDASVSRPEASRHDLRFLRSHRLTARKQYLAVYGRGRRVGSRNLALFGLPNDVGQCRLGITATRKVGGAVRRNRVKRVLREVYRRNRAVLREPIDLVVNAHPRIHELSYAEIEREFLDAFGRLARRIR